MVPVFWVFVMKNVFCVFPKSGITYLSVNGVCTMVYLSNFVVDASFISISYWGTT